MLTRGTGGSAAASNQMIRPELLWQTHLKLITRIARAERHNDLIADMQSGAPTARELDPTMPSGTHDAREDKIANFRVGIRYQKSGRIGKVRPAPIEFSAKVSKVSGRAASSIENVLSKR
jgi:hypothetical protein